MCEKEVRAREGLITGPAFSIRLFFSVYVEHIFLPFGIFIGEGRNDVLKKLNDAMDYIEAHLEDAFLLEKISEQIQVSDHHFRKIFFALTNITIGEYVRNRRLSEAGKELLQGAQVTDVAYKYGYQSMDGFSRAFKKWSGILPSQVATLKQCRSYQKLQFVVTIKGGCLMDYRIVEKPAFTFAGVSKRVPLQFEGVNHAILELAQSITPEQQQEMHRLQNMAPYEIVNVSCESDTNFLEEAGDLTHLIGVLTTEIDQSDLLDTLSVKAYTWAVFPNEGPFPFTLQDTMAKIYSEWFMTADYELAGSLSFSFTKMDEKNNSWAYSEIWIPVIKKS